MTRRELISRLVAAAGPVYGEREAAAIARLIVEKRYGLSRADCALDPEAAVETGDEFAYILADVAAARPVQYILGVADFDGLELAVGKGVLIPRPETEELVRWIAAAAAHTRILDTGTGRNAGGDLAGADSKSDPLHVDDFRILDIGTGSGAIAIALAKRLPGARVTAVDVSPEALEYARRNNARTAAGVEILEADILNPGSFSIFNFQFSIIVSNPPYIPAAERTRMAPNVTEHEPVSALFVPDADPLVFYRAIARFASRNLIPGGALYFEIHEAAAEAVARLLQSEGFVSVEVREDINSKPRMIKCLRP